MDVSNLEVLNYGCDSMLDNNYIQIDHLHTKLIRKCHYDNITYSSSSSFFRFSFEEITK